LIYLVYITRNDNSNSTFPSKAFLNKRDAEKFIEVENENPTYRANIQKLELQITNDHELFVLSRVCDSHTYPIIASIDRGDILIKRESLLEENIQLRIDKIGVS